MFVPKNNARLGATFPNVLALEASNSRNGMKDHAKIVAAKMILFSTRNSITIIPIQIGRQLNGTTSQ